MDGEILFSDVERFAALKDLVDADLKDRAQWYDRAVKNRAERFKRTNTASRCTRARRTSWTRLS